MSEITPEAVKAARDAATPGPWRKMYGDVYAEAQDLPVAMCTDDVDGYFIAMAPSMADLIEAQAEEILRLRKQVELADALVEKTYPLDQMEMPLVAWAEQAIGMTPDGFTHAMAEMKQARIAYRATQETPTDD